MKYQILLRMLIMTVLLLLSSGINLQILAQQDSTKLTLTELKLTAQLLTELQFRRDEEDLFKEKEKVYTGMIQNFQSNEKLYEEQIANLRANIEAVKPEWYEKPPVVIAATAIILSTIFFLAR